MTDIIKALSGMALGGLLIGVTAIISIFVSALAAFGIVFVVI